MHSEFNTHLAKKGYVKLPLNSYRTCISGKWHAMFVRRGLVQKNFYGQYSPNTATLQEFIKWLELYDKTQHDRDFPNSYKQLTPQEIIEIRAAVV